LGDTTWALTAWHFFKGSRVSTIKAKTSDKMASLTKGSPPPFVLGFLLRWDGRCWALRTPRGALCAFAVYVALPVLCVMYVLCMRFVPTSVVYVACIPRIYHITVVCVRFIGVGCRVSRIGVFGFVSVGLDDFFFGQGWESVSILYILYLFSLVSFRYLVYFNKSIRNSRTSICHRRPL
jgi:hypothetical protein